MLFRSPKWFYFSIHALHYFYWIVGTFLGGVIGNLIAFNTQGLDFALTALFVVLFLEQMRKRENWIFGLIGVAGALAARLIFGSANMVIPALIGILITLIAGRKLLCR